MDTVMTLSNLLLGIIILSSIHVDFSRAETTEEWLTVARAELDRALNLKRNENFAKNVVFFIGDGMGVSTVTASRALKAQLAGQRGKQPLMSFEKFPAVGLAKTYSNDYLTPASAATATAFLCGVKTNGGTLGVPPDVQRGDCEGSKIKRLDSVLKWSIEAGKTAGVVTTSRITHATPAASYAHSADRNWEGTREVASGCKDIAAQLFDNLDLQVIMGGGRRYILPNTQNDPETGAVDRRQRNDSRDLIKEWEDKQMGKGMKAKYVYNKGQFDVVNPAETDYLLGLFAPSHMSYEVDRDTGANGEPSIAEMTRKAIQILKKNDKGFILFVESARIDHGHHNNSAHRALRDVIALDEAVAAAVEETDEKDTLIVVSADHSHVFNLAGYPTRQVDILGFVDNVTTAGTPYDQFPYTTLIYGNGPGPGRTNLTGVNTADINFQHPNAVQMRSETHAGEDVAIYALGPMSHLIHGVHEQHYIAHVIAYASCVGSGKTCCYDNMCVGSGSRISLNLYQVLVAILAYKQALKLIQ